MASEEETTSLVCNNEDGNDVVNFKDIFSEAEKTIAIGLEKADDATTEAVQKAFLYFNGDLEAFKKSECYRFLALRNFDKIVAASDVKLSAHGITAIELKELTDGDLEKKYSEEKCSVLKKLKSNLRKQLSRRKHSLETSLAEGWVILLILKSYYILINAFNTSPCFIRKHAEYIWKG